MTREDREAYQLVRERFARRRGRATRASSLESLAGRDPGYADLHYMVGLLRERQTNLDGAASALSGRSS